MKLLLDTHSLLWYADGSPRLSAIASRLILDPANSLYLSVASVWEVAIKSNLKKLQLQNGFEHFLSRAISLCGIHLMDVTLDDCVGYEALPFPLANHRDPFDRMIIVQAMRNGMDVIGADTNFDAYGITRRW